MNHGPVQLAFIGLKGINLWHYLPAVRSTPKARLVGGVDIAAEARRHFREQSGCPTYESLQELCVHHGVEAVFVGTPNPIHLPNILEAAAAGLHISVTKPLCNTVQEARQAIGACANQKLVLQAGHEYRFRPSIRKAIAMARQGAVGALSLATAHMGSNGGLSALTTVGTWRSRAENVPGGCLNLLGVHLFDVLNAIFGRPVAVSASLARLVARSEIENTAAVTLEYEAGRIGVVTSSYVSAHRDQLTIFGTEANLVANERQLSRQINRELIPVEDLPKEGSATVVIEQFCDAIRNGTPLETPAEAGLMAVAMNEAALRSHQQRRRVALSELLEAEGRRTEP